MENAEAKGEQMSFDSIPIHTCSFTGHREIRHADEKIVKERLVRAIDYAYSKGCRIFYCGGALGFDTLAAREVIRFSVTHNDAELCLVLPCLDQAAKWSSRQRADYDYILKNAKITEYVSDEYTPSCMKERNTRLAELGDILVAYLYRSGSGSSQTVRIAKELGKPVYNLAPTQKTV